MPLDSQVQKLLLQLDQLGLPPLPSLEPAQAREMTAKLRARGFRTPTNISIENRTIEGAVGDIPIRIYKSREDNATKPLLIFFHGGGWVLGDLNGVENICRFLALHAGCIVISVDYRLAPEFKFPAAVEDGYAAVCWAAQNAHTLNGDSARIAVAGESAGGNIAAAVSLMARDRGEPSLVYQLLIYPVTNYSFDTQSYQDYGQGGFGLTKAEMSWFWQHYLVSPDDGQNPYASPLLASCHDLPPTCIITAECDVLRDEAEAYAVRVQTAGIPAQLWRYDGMIHNFVALAPALDRAKNALFEIAAQLRKTLV
jgi:acetyl esterase